MEFGLSDYYIIGELITCWGSVLICINTLLSYALYDKHQRYFLVASASTFAASLFNIFSVYFISYFSEYPAYLCTIFTTLYFLVLLICPCIMTCYVFDMAIQNKKKLHLYFLISGGILVAYILLVILNFCTRWIFYYDEVQGYTRGPIKNITYVLTLAYGIAIVITVLIQRRYLARRIFWVFMAYPFVSIFFVAIQFFFPKVILTGVASFTSVLFAYVTIQSYSMGINLKTGLMMDSRLRKRISIQRKGGSSFCNDYR